MSEPQANINGMLVAPVGGLRGWFIILSPRDRAIYAIMLAMLSIIVAIYLFIGLKTFFQPDQSFNDQNPVANATATAQPVADRATELPSSSATYVATDMPTPTELPTLQPSITPTPAPSKAPIMLLPTIQPTQAASATSTVVTTSAPATEPTATPSRPSITNVPRPTRTPQPAATATTQPAPTNPASAASVQAMTLYFADTTGKLLVPVRRNVNVIDKRIAEAAVRDLIAGPRNGLQRLLAANTQLLGISINGNLVTINFDHDPTGGNELGFDSIVFSLTEPPFSLTQVQIQINGQNYGSTRKRSVLNPVNPSHLDNNASTTEFLPLYFPSVDGRHDVRVIRMVPKTKQVGEATVLALIEGPPAEYTNALRRVIPADTALRGIAIHDGIIQVDFTQPFADAPDVGAAMRSVVESLTTIKSVTGVQFLVEGRAFADGQIFRRPVINQE